MKERLESRRLMSAPGHRRSRGSPDAWRSAKRCRCRQSSAYRPSRTRPLPTTSARFDSRPARSGRGAGAPVAIPPPCRRIEHSAASTFIDGRLTARMDDGEQSWSRALRRLGRWSRLANRLEHEHFRSTQRGRSGPQTRTTACARLASRTSCRRHDLSHREPTSSRDSTCRWTTRCSFSTEAAVRLIAPPPVAGPPR